MLDVGMNIEDKERLGLRGRARLAAPLLLREAGHIPPRSNSARREQVTRALKAHSKKWRAADSNLQSKSDKNYDGRSDNPEACPLLSESMLVRNGAVAASVASRGREELGCGPSRIPRGSGLESGPKISDPVLLFLTGSQLEKMYIRQTMY
jgi:hypothetical protein